MIVSQRICIKKANEFPVCFGNIELFHETTYLQKKKIKKLGEVHDILSEAAHCVEAHFATDNVTW